MSMHAYVINYGMQVYSKLKTNARSLCICFVHGHYFYLCLLALLCSTIILLFLFIYITLANTFTFYARTHTLHLVLKSPTNPPLQTLLFLFSTLSSILYLSISLYTTTIVQCYFQLTSVQPRHKLFIFTLTHSHTVSRLHFITLSFAFLALFYSIRIHFIV